MRDGEFLAMKKVGEEKKGAYGRPRQGVGGPLSLSLSSFSLHTLHI